MAGAVKVRLLGVSRLSARLGARQKRVEEELMSSSNKAAAIVTSGAKSIAPVRSGALRRSIHPIKAEKQSNGTVTSGAATSLEYAPYVEFGTGVRGSETAPYQPKGGALAYKSDWAGQAAQPYMYPALHQSKSKIQKVFRQGMMRAAVRKK